MGAQIIQAQYDQLASVAQRFGAQAEACIAMQQHLLQRMEPLKQGGWQGRGSQAFFAEMNGTALPALQRLGSALREAKKVNLQISHLMKQAEEEAARPFRDRDGADQVSIADPKVQPVHDPSRDRKYLWGLITDEYHYEPTYQHFTGSISPDGISPGDIAQGLLGDCYFLAGLATVAQQHPEAIWNAIRDNGDGTYTVTFYQDGKPMLVTVDADFPVREDVNGNPTGIPAYAGVGSTGDELWPLIMEKAYAQLDKNDYGGIEGGWPGDAVQLLTGTSPERLDLSASTPEVTRLQLETLQSHLDNGNYLTVATRPKGPFEDEGAWPNNVVPLHAYSVERVDVANGLIYLRNPWGSLYAPQPMTLEQFNRYYNYVAINRPANRS